MIPPLAAAPIGDGTPQTSTPRDSRFADSLAGALAVADVLAAAAATAVPSPVGADATSTATVAAAGESSDIDPTASASGDVVDGTPATDGPNRVDAGAAAEVPGAEPADAWTLPLPAEATLADLAAVASSVISRPKAGALALSTGPTPMTDVAGPATEASDLAPPAITDGSGEAERAPDTSTGRGAGAPHASGAPSPPTTIGAPRVKVEHDTERAGLDPLTPADDSPRPFDAGRSVVTPSPAAPTAGASAATAASGPPATGPGSSAAAAATDTVRYLRELGPARAVQRLAVDLDGTTVAVRIDHSGVTPSVHVHVLDDPAGRLDPSWTTGVERTLAQTLGRDHQPGGDRRDRRPHEDPPNDETHAPAARRWADALTGVRP